MLKASGQRFSGPIILALVSFRIDGAQACRFVLMVRRPVVALHGGHCYNVATLWYHTKELAMLTVDVRSRVEPELMDNGDGHLLACHHPLTSPPEQT